MKFWDRLKGIFGAPDTKPATPERLAELERVRKEQERLAVRHEELAQRQGRTEERVGRLEAILDLRTDGLSAEDYEGEEQGEPTG